MSPPLNSPLNLPLEPPPLQSPSNMGPLLDEFRAKLARLEAADGWRGPAAEKFAHRAAILGTELEEAQVYERVLRQEARQLAADMRDDLAMARSLGWQR